MSTGATNSLDTGYDVIVIIGQSNAMEQGTFANGNLLDAAVNPLHPRIKQWGRKKATNSGGTTFDATYQDQVVAATFPLMHFGGYEEYNTNGNASGFGLSLAAEYLKTCPPNRDVLLVPAARGSTQISQWAPGSASIPSVFTGLGLFDDAVRKTNAAIASNPNNRIVLVAWSQGESNALAGADGTSYASTLANIIATFRAQVTGAGSVPWVLAPMVTDFWGLSYPGGGSAVAAGSSPAITAYGPTATATTIAGMQNAIDATAGIAAYTGIVPRTLRADLTGNGAGWTNTGGQIHFSAYSHRTLGQRLAANALPSARANTATPPAASVVTVGTPTTTTLPLTWTSVTGATAYTVRYRLQGATDWTFITLGNVTSTTITGLTISTAYDIQVSAINGSTDVATMSALVSGSTAAASPATAYTTSLSATTFTVGSTAPVATMTPTSGPWPASEAITLTMPVAGTWSSPVNGTLAGNVLTVTTNSVASSATFTPSAAGSGNFTKTTSPSMTDTTGAIAVTVNAAPATATSYTTSLTSASSMVTGTGYTETFTPNGVWPANEAITLTMPVAGTWSAPSQGTFSGNVLTLPGTGMTSTAVTATFTPSAAGTGNFTKSTSPALTDTTGALAVTVSAAGGSYPSTAGTLIARHDFTLLTGTNGSAVASVPDQSGNGNALTCTSVTLATNVAGFTSKNGATTAGGTLTKSGLSGGLTGTSDCSGFVVFNAPMTSSAGMLVQLNNTSTAAFTGDQVYGILANAGVDWYHITGGATAPEAFSASTLGVANGKNWLAWRYTASSKTIDVWYNGTKVTATSGSQTPTGTALNLLTLGNSSFSPGRPLSATYVYHEVKSGLYTDSDITTTLANYAAGL